MDIEPLVEKIVARNAVVVTGAGASLSSGLPLWPEFIQQCLTKAKRARGLDECVERSDPIWKAIETYLEGNDFLTAAELLQHEIGDSLEQYVWEAFGGNESPSDLHLAVARLPFDLLITTNYDKLLESAFQVVGKPIPLTTTWQNPRAIYRSIRDGRRTIVKAHGTVGQGTSLILTHSQYRDLEHPTSPFMALLEHIASYRSCLFVGHSLRDSDILKALESARRSHGSASMRHYAIRFDCSPGEQANLADRYGITVIPAGPLKDDPDENTLAVVDILREIHGRVALELSKTSSPVEIDEPFVMSNEMLASRCLDSAISLCGAFRGDISFIDDEFAPRLRLASSKTSSHGRRDVNLYESGLAVEPEWISGRAFYRGGAHPYIYIRDVRDSDALRLARDGRLQADYYAAHSDVASELAVPVVNRGSAVGVINIESNIPDAFSTDHLDVLKRCATRAAAAWEQIQSRRRISSSLEPFYDAKALKELLDTSRAIRSLDLGIFSYNIDYDSGSVVAHFSEDDRGEPGVFSYSFDDNGIATRVLAEEWQVYIEDIDKEIDEGAESRVNAGAARTANARGMAYGLPILREGRISIVISCYSRRIAELMNQVDPSRSRTFESIKNDPQAGAVVPEIELLRHKFHESIRLIRSSISMVVNDDSALSTGHTGGSRSARMFSAADRGIRSINKEFDIDGDVEWPPNLLGNADFQRAVFGGVLSGVVRKEDGPGAYRARLWWVRPDGVRITPSEIPNKEIAMICLASRVRADSTDFSEWTSHDLYRGTAVFSDEKYYRTLFSAASAHACARSYSSKVFHGETDEDADVLDKCEEGVWMTVPIVSFRNSENGEVLGLLTIDRQRVVDVQWEEKEDGWYGHATAVHDEWKTDDCGTNEVINRERLAFRGYALEATAELLRSVMENLNAEALLRDFETLYTSMGEVSFRCDVRDR